MSSREKEVADIFKNSTDSGTFVAYVDGRKFLKSSSVTFQVEHLNEYRIGGIHQNENWVSFSILSSLVGDGPHVVEYPSGSMIWDAMTDGVWNPAQYGSSVTVTFFKGRHRVKGTINFVLRDGRKVTGEFDISRPLSQ
ncbi:hypothetical protein KKQ10_08480 [Pseudomonas sp. MG-9]|uniref:hypothetical protein n=1 Tax=Pseudomonas sp. MG-9 TaxID=2839032 RepID=UPI001BFFDFA7|nr:hypothetical protein [Pseudomonas sp. MG-9]MBT9264911.1 hypothetical protein [Pseudomonas sp. MG-9]